MGEGNEEGQRIEKERAQRNGSGGREEGATRGETR